VLRDMLVSLATAMLIVLPLMWIALKELRLFFAAAVANLLPLVLPLALMAATGITLRIGTAVVLAIALGIVVDNTLHIIIRLRAQARDERGAPGQMDRAMRGTGRAVIFTTLALVGGFLSMLSNQLLAIRDMGLVAAVTISGAMFADLLILPALYVMLTRKRISRQDIENLSRESAR
jgi:predicted RND superfamily exporter protein